MGEFKVATGADAEDQVAIRRWFVFATLKNAFGSSSDTTLTRLRELLILNGSGKPFPAQALYDSLGIEPRFTDGEVEGILSYPYQGRYTNLVLSLLYPDRDWKDAVFHEDHIFPKSGFQVRALRKLGLDDAKIDSYLGKFNLLPNIQLLTESENLSKNATPFDEWIRTREAQFRERHLIPEMSGYGFEAFGDFFEYRRDLIAERLRAL